PPAGRRSRRQPRQGHHRSQGRAPAGRRSRPPQRISIHVSFRLGAEPSRPPFLKKGPNMRRRFGWSFLLSGLVLLAALRLAGEEKAAIRITPVGHPPQLDDFIAA